MRHDDDYPLTPEYLQQVIPGDGLYLSTEWRLRLSHDSQTVLLGRRHDAEHELLPLKLETRGQLRTQLELLGKSPAAIEELTEGRA